MKKIVSAASAVLQHWTYALCPRRDDYKLEARATINTHRNTQPPITAPTTPPKPSRLGATRTLHRHQYPQYPLLHGGGYFHA